MSGKNRNANRNAVVTRSGNGRQLTATAAAKPLSLANVARAVARTLGNKKPGPTKAFKNRAPAKQAKINGKVAAMQQIERNAQAEYIACVFRPDMFTAKIPSPVPVPSCLCHSKNTMYISAAATTGNLVIRINPWYDTAPLTYCIDASVTESAAWSSFAGWVSGPASTINAASANAVSRRVVGAYLEIECLTPDFTRTGIASVAYIPYDPVISGFGFTYDSLRDQPDAQTISLNSTTRLRAIAKPYDNTYQEYGPINDAPGDGSSSHPTITIAISGATTGSVGHTFRVSYRIIHEFIPHPTKTDLLMPTAGPSGDSAKNVNIIEKLNKLKNEATSVINKIGVTPADIVNWITGGVASLEKLFS